MIHSKTYIINGLIFCFISIMIFLSGVTLLAAYEINWIEVANTNNEIQSIDANSIRYNIDGFLSVVTKYSETNPEDKEIINTKSYLMAIDCEKRLFSKLPLNGELKQVKTWIKPINDKLMKTTIINSCSY